MAQTWYVIRGDTTTQISGGTLSYRVSASNIGAPPKRNLSIRGPFQNGESFQGFRYDKRIMSLVFFSDASTLSLADSQRDDIYDLWKGIENETVTIKVVRDDGEIRLIDGEVVNVIDFPDAVGNRYAGSQQFVVQLECHNPFWRSESIVVKNISYNTTSTITYDGQFPVEPIINIFGPITNPVLTQVATGKKLDFTGITIAAGDNYQIDTRYGYKTVLDGDYNSKLADLTIDSNLADFNHQTFTTTEGNIWSAISATEANDWTSIAYGNGVWIAVSSDGTNRVMRSTNDGATWSAIAAAEANEWRSVAYGNGVWIAVSSDGTNRVMRSTNDGVTWSAIAAAEANEWRSVAYDNGAWVAVASTGANQVMRSTDDGLTWSAIAAANANQWASVAYGNGVWVAVSSAQITINQRIMRSTDDGVTWSGITPAQSNPWRSVAYGNGVWVAVSSCGNNRVMRSTDGGLTWSAIFATEPNEWLSIAYNNIGNTWIAVASSGTNRVMESFNDGLTWKSIVAVEQNEWTSVAYGNGVWNAVAKNGTNRIMSSADTSQDYTLTGTGTTSATSATMTYNNVFLGI
jgi:hypothetical protein